MQGVSIEHTTFSAEKIIYYKYGAKMQTVMKILGFMQYNVSASPWQASNIDG